jgi:hypothetical protein
MGIFRGKEVWATNINHLNDASEIRHAMSLLLAEVESRLKEAGTDLEYRRIWEAYLEEWTGSQPKSDSGVVSFSTNGNQLSQWRAYCPRGNGYSIGFSPADLSYARKAANAFLVKCIYDPAEQRELICAVADYMALSRRRSERFDWVAQLGFLGSTSRKVLAAMLAIKNGGFEEEGEWRLVVEGVKDTPTSPPPAAATLHPRRIPHRQAAPTSSPSHRTESAASSSRNCVVSVSSRSSGPHFVPSLHTTSAKSSGNVYSMFAVYTLFAPEPSIFQSWNRVSRRSSRRSCRCESLHNRRPALVPRGTLSSFR